MPPFQGANIQAPFYKREDIQHAVDEFRRKYKISDDLPLDIEKIVEFDLGLEMRPIGGLKEVNDVDALLLRDRSAIIVDLRDFSEERFQNRLRFSLAHEIGHYVLHENVYEQIAFASEEEWIDFVTGVPSKEWGYMEWHANEFAARLLIPTAPLQGKIEASKKAGLKKAKQLSISLNFENVNPDLLLTSIAEDICGDFGVSGDAVCRRMKSEGLISEIPRKRLPQQ